MYILAGNKMQADMYCKDNHITHFVYVSDYEKIIGAKQGDTLVLVGDFYNRKDAHEIVLMAKSRNMKIERFGDLKGRLANGCKKD